MVKLWPACAFAEFVDVGAIFVATLVAFSASRTEPKAEKAAAKIKIRAAFLGLLFKKKGIVT